MPNLNGTGPTGRGCGTGKGVGHNVDTNMQKIKFPGNTFYSVVGIVLPILAKKVLPRLIKSTTKILKNINTKRITKL